MDKFKNLVAHFNEYWNKKDPEMVKNNSINSYINRETMRTAAEGVPTIQDAPVKGKVQQPEQSPVLESVEDLDTTVSREIGKKFDLQIRRVIEDIVRKYLGPDFQLLEKAIRPQVEQEVAEQSKEVKQDIKQVVPAISKIEDKVTETPKEAPAKAPEAPKEAPKEPVKASLDKAALLHGTCNACGNTFDINPEDPGTTCPKCGSTDVHLTPYTPKPQQGLEVEVPLSDVQVIGKKASETQTEENSIQSNLNTTREEIRVSGQ